MFCSVDTRIRNTDFWFIKKIGSFLWQNIGSKFRKARNLNSFRFRGGGGGGNNVLQREQL